MSGKKARERRQDGQNLRSLVGSQPRLPQIKGPVHQFDALEVAAYLAVRRSLDDLLLGSDGLLKVQPMEKLAQIPWSHLRIWMHEMGYFTLPTLELVDWLHREIRGRSAIEICAGSGVLGRALCVPCIDAQVHRRPDSAAFYALTKQPVPCIGPHVEYLDANSAVAKYHPRVVFGTYITQRSQPGEPPTAASSVHGVDQAAIVRRVETYIAIGSKAVHGKMRVNRSSTRTCELPGLVSRAVPGDGIAFIWDAPGTVDR